MNARKIVLVFLNYHPLKQILSGGSTSMHHPVVSNRKKFTFILNSRVYFIDVKHSPTGEKIPKADWDGAKWTLTTWSTRYVQIVVHIGFCFLAKIFSLFLLFLKAPKTKKSETLRVENHSRESGAMSWANRCVSHMFVIFDITFKADFCKSFDTIMRIKLALATSAKQTSKVN